MKYTTVQAIGNVHPYIVTTVTTENRLWDHVTLQTAFIIFVILFNLHCVDIVS